MSDTSSLGSRSSIAKIHDLFYNGYSYAGETAQTSIKSARRPGMPRSLGLVAKHILLVAVVITTVVLLIVVGRVPGWQSTASSYARQFDNCNANGTFTPNRSPTFSLWDGSGLFQITLTWGNLTFSQAKALDVVWDIIVGRGGQAILLYVAFNVFTMTLSRTMETDPVSYGTFESMAFTSPTFVSPFILIRDFVTNRGLRARAAVAWTIVASLFVLAFPTLNDTVSGYSTNMEAFLKDNSGILIPWSNYSEVQFVINDGDRVGLGNPAYVTDDPSSPSSCALNGPHLSRLDQGSMSTATDTDQARDWAGVPKNCTLFWHVVEYAHTYGFEGKNQTTSTFNRSGEIETLPAPILNVTSLYTPSGFSALVESLNGAPNSDSHFLDLVQDNMSQALWIWKGEVYNLSYVLAEGQCLPLMTHNWGFSFLGLFIVMVFTAVWSVGMYVMWMDAYLNSRFSRVGRDLGTYRASWDFADAMRRDMGGDGSVTEAMSNRQVKTRVRQARNGNRVRYRMDDPDVPISRLDELRIWWSGVDVRRGRTPLRREKRRPTSLEPLAHERDSMLDPPLSTGSSAFRSPLPSYMQQSPSLYQEARFGTN